MQIYGRLFNRIRFRRTLKVAAATPRSITGAWSAPARRRGSFSADGQPHFLNRVGGLAEPSDWNAPEASRLWLYNLHYFDDLNALDAEDRHSLHQKLIRRWVEENPAFGGRGWEPYPTSLRIVNWTKWSLSGQDLDRDVVASLALQTAWLEKNIEWHLLGNHLFANAKALVFAGLFFEGKAAARWLRKGLAILKREVPEQVLSDGGQFELSPMYHSIATEDVLDLINVSRTFPGLVPESQAVDWTNVAKRMLAWADVMQHPDGKIVLFNDSAFGIAPELDEIWAYADRLDIEWPSSVDELQMLEDSGYVRADTENAVLFVDVARIGPDYLPGHAHADTLTFELSLFGERWIVDTGCSTYEVSEERLRQRGTAAHNTVTVDGEDSSEVWSSFRVARRARPFDVKIQSEAGQTVVSAGHDGYRRLKGRVGHTRVFGLSSGRLDIADRLTGSPRSAVANFLLHPEINAGFENGNINLVRAGRSAEFNVDGGEVRLEDATWHPEFGLSFPTKRIKVLFTHNTLKTTISWKQEP